MTRKPYLWRLWRMEPKANTRVPTSLGLRPKKQVFLAADRRFQGSRRFEIDWKRLMRFLFGERGE